MENHTDINKTLHYYFNDFAKQMAEIRHNLLHNKEANLPEYLTPPQAAALTGFTLRALEAMRAKRTGPEYVKVGKAKNGPIRYRLEDVRAWMQSHREVPHVGR